MKIESIIQRIITYILVFYYIVAALVVGFTGVIFSVSLQTESHEQILIPVIIGTCVINVLLMTFFEKLVPYLSLLGIISWVGVFVFTNFSLHQEAPNLTVTIILTIAYFEKHLIGFIPVLLIQMIRKILQMHPIEQKNP